MQQQKMQQQGKGAPATGKKGAPATATGTPPAPEASPARRRNGGCKRQADPFGRPDLPSEQSNDDALVFLRMI